MINEGGVGNYLQNIVDIRKLYVYLRSRMWCMFVLSLMYNLSSILLCYIGRYIAKNIYRYIPTFCLNFVF